MEDNCPLFHSWEAHGVQSCGGEITQLMSHTCLQTLNIAEERKSIRTLGSAQCKNTPDPLDISVLCSCSQKTELNLKSVITCCKALTQKGGTSLFIFLENLHPGTWNTIVSGVLQKCTCRKILLNIGGTGDELGFCSLESLHLGVLDKIYHNNASVTLLLC